MVLSFTQILTDALGHHQQGRLREAGDGYRAVLALAPGQPDALNLLGVLSRQQGRTLEALDLVRSAIAQNPGQADFHNNLGTILQDLGDLVGAVTAYRRATDLRTAFVAAHHNLARALHAQGASAEAIAHYRVAAQALPGDAMVLTNFGAAVKSVGFFDPAVALFRRALALQPALGEAWNNLGNALTAVGRPLEAVPCYDHGLAIDPDNAEVHRNRGLANLLAGRLAEGWKGHEWRWAIAGMREHRRRFAQPQWDGAALARRSILVYAEQGLGDTLQFVRYIPAVAARGGRIILEVQAAILPLLGDLPKGTQLVAAGTGLPDFTMQVPLMTLPTLLTPDLVSIPAKIPYLSVDPTLVRHWRRQLDMASSGGNPGDNPAPLKVGLVWAGNPAHSNDAARSAPASALLPLAALPGVVFYALQKSPTGGAPEPPSGMVVANLGPRLATLADTAAVIANLDLVISVDTAVAHLAGALGKPVWIMLPHAPDWRWMLGREDSPWYPTAKLFRQDRPGDWTGPVARIAEALSALIGAIGTHL